MAAEVEKDKKTVSRLIKKLGDLPSAPVILTRALRLTSDLQSNIADLVRSLSADQSLSAKVIRMSNSPLYARFRRVASLDEAITVLGFGQLKSVVITATTFRVFDKSEHAAVAGDLWQHSLSSAIGARLIARRFGQVDKEEAYLAGLLHDIGKLVLLKMVPNLYARIIEEVKSSGKGFHEIENRELGFDHADVGEALLIAWEFPTSIQRAVMVRHHCPIHERPPEIELSRIVWLADNISRYNGASFYEPYRHVEGGDIYIGPTKVFDDDLIALRSEVEEQFHSELNHIYQ